MTAVALIAAFTAGLLTMFCWRDARRDQLEAELDDATEREQAARAELDHWQRIADTRARANARGIKFTVVE